MNHWITVSPVLTEWAVVHNSAEPLMFLSGAQAETWARRLAKRLANEGRSVEVEIFLRNGALAGHLAFGPASSGTSQHPTRKLEPA